MSTSGKPAETVQVADRRQWRAWLERNHATSDGIWLIVHKKGSSQGGLALSDVVEEALCFGWIDSGLRPLDAERFTLFLSPRQLMSVWSRANKQRIERLIDQGLMTEAGLRVIEDAKKNGSWRQLDDIEALVIPGDLASALAENETAETNFAAFSASHRKMILWWIASARRAETRANRIAETVAEAAENIKAARYE